MCVRVCVCVCMCARACVRAHARWGREAEIVGGGGGEKNFLVFFLVLFWTRTSRPSPSMASKWRTQEAVFHCTVLSVLADLYCTGMRCTTMHFTALYGTADYIALYCTVSRPVNISSFRSYVGKS